MSGLKIALPSLAIIIVNWNAGKFLRQCLESVAKAKRDVFVLKQVVVVDNASTDGSADRLSCLDLPLAVIRNAKNRGFAAACNQGVSVTQADYLLFLNPDTRLYPDSLSTPIIFMEKADNAQIGICGIKLVDEGGNPSTTCARFPTLAIYISEMLGLSKFFPKYFFSHIMLPEDLLHSKEVDQVIGAFFLIRTELFVCLGGFDERFLVYFEEVDLSLRAKQLGYSSYYLADVAAHHVGRVCSKQNPSAALFYSLSSRLKYAWKHYSPWEAVILIGLTFSVELMSRMFWAKIGSSAVGVRDVLSAYERVAVALLMEGLGCK